jgi:hypothetical protein
MTEQEFIDLLQRPSNPNTIEGALIEDKIYKQFKITSTGVVIKNCVFKESVIFDKCDLNYGVKFINCTFEKVFAIIDCIASQHDFKFNFDGYHIEINETTIPELHFHKKNEIERGVQICNNSRIGKLTLNGLQIKTGSFSIFNSEITSIIDIRDVTFGNALEFRANCRIREKIRIVDLTAPSLTFTDSTFEKDIHLWAGKLGSLTFNNGIFNDDFNVKAVPISSYFTIIGTEFKKTFSINIHDETNGIKGSFDKVYISSAKFGEQLVLNGGDIEINELTIKLNKQLEGSLYFNYCKFLLTKISGDNYSGNIVFNHSKFNILALDFFNNYSTLSFNSLKSFNAKSELSITNSNLGETQFFNTLFNSFDSILINDSILNDILVANVKWFEDKYLNKNLLNDDNSYLQKREIYRQIKYALEKQGDRITSLHFKALEMRAFKKDSFKKAKWYSRLLNNDRFILWVGQTNCFGQNWGYPILWALGFTLFYYSLIVVGASDDLTYCFNFRGDSFSATWSEMIKYAYIIPQLLNPTHLISRLLPNSLESNFPVYLFDFIQKITLAFFIFQIISAFRKYMK